MDPPLSPERLFEIVELQQEIIASSLDTKEVMGIVVERSRELLGAAAAVIEIPDGEELVYRIASGLAREHIGLRLSLEHSLSGLCIAQGEALHCRNAVTDVRVNSAAAEAIGAISVICAPLTHNERTAGVLKVYDPRANAFDVEAVSTIGLLSGVVAAALAHANDYQAREYASRHDALTGLLNRAEFDQRLGVEVARARRYDEKTALCLLDLDRFKEVNDRLGHAAGDDVLRALASHLAAIRLEDGAFRIGGDEFALILTHTGKRSAARVTDRLVLAVANDPNCRDVGVSVGVSMLDRDDPADNFAQADAALYEAKRSRAGRVDPPAAA
jgi:diguanylate cyclase (GGDEF)-like protein